MDGSPPENLYLQERRRRLAAERTLDRTRHELSRAHSALVANADRLSLRYLTERETNVRLTDRQKEVMAQRKEAAEKADRARRRLWHALEAMRDGFALFDSHARLVAANSVYLNLFDAESAIGPGATAEQMFMAAAEEGAFIIEDDDTDGWVEAQLARWQQEQIGVQVLHTFDGRAIRFQDRRAPDGDIVSLAIDISDVEAREQSLAEARDAAEEVARAKAAFLARMSHEMRTPMNGVLGLAELLCEQGIDEESKTYARTIRDSAEALLTIVNDTLDVSRLEAGRVDLRTGDFDLEAMLCDCLRLASAGKAAQGIVVALAYPLDAPVRFIGDAGRVRQIVMNLVGNGLKFTDLGHVIVGVNVVTEGAGAAITIDVADTGPGIPPDKRAEVFDAFTQIDDGRAQKEGTGLGLTISKGLAEQMGGGIRVVDSELTTGACFRLTLKLPLAEDRRVMPPRPVAVAIPPGCGVQGDVLARRLA
ncbi:MAG: ATP-binding protein, partial [Jannaschia sp.]